MRVEDLPAWVVQDPAGDIGRHRPPTCPLCQSVGTIVELGACCLIAEFIALGGLWEDWRKYMAPLAPPPRRRK